MEFDRVCSSFCCLTSFSLPARPVSTRDDLLLIKFCSFFSPFRMGLTNPSQALGRFSLLSTSAKLSTLSGIPFFSTNLFWLVCVLALLVGLNLSFLIATLAWFFKIAKVAPFKSVDMFCKDPFLALYFFSFHQRCYCFSSLF